MTQRIRDAAAVLGGLLLMVASTMLVVAGSRDPDLRDARHDARLEPIALGAGPTDPASVGVATGAHAAIPPAPGQPPRSAETSVEAATTTTRPPAVTAPSAELTSPTTTSALLAAPSPSLVSEAPATTLPPVATVAPTTTHAPATTAPPLAAPPTSAPPPADDCTIRVKDPLFGITICL